MFRTIRYAALISLSLLVSVPTSAFSAERPPADYVDPVTDMEFMAIPGSTFVMGDKEDERSQPQHEVTIKPFLFGRFEVTFEQYAKFCSSTGRPIPSDSGWGMADRPVINVSWQDAVDFTKWLSGKSGKTFRLPSEAEWEFAARGGATTKFPWGDEIGRNIANCKECGSEWDDRMTAPVGSFAPNGYGLYDMTGNVYEWCLDARHDSYLGAPADGSVWGQNGKSNDMIIRGGAWNQPVKELTITRRCWDRADRKKNEYGFRVLLKQE
ncbi:MAG: formylglycine-generating enzyme family protein [Desulfuromonadales bacterium]|nr:formylglycine-generating enzyme family protein [Desulfuromonadales bacterium]